MQLLLVGWDAADWKVIDPLLQRGDMPHLGRLLSQGVRGNSATIYPPLSPMVWSSIATGKRPTKHGIHGFTEPTEDGLSVRPVSNLGRKAKAFWNILNQNGKRCIVVGWWPSHPAEPINGATVSNHFPLSAADDPARPMASATVHPAELADRLAELRVHPTEITGDILRLFVPQWQTIDQEKDKSLHDLAGIIAETMSIHAAATDLIESEPWDMAAIYFAGIDHFSHRFMRYHARKRRGRGETTDPALFRDVIAGAYRYHDLMLGRLVELAGPDSAVMVISDHGFHSDSLLPDHIPAEAAGPAVEHRDFGIFCLKAPGVRRNERIFGSSVLDIAPTILHLFGLPAGADMDGKVLINAFTDPTLPERIPSWDTVPGEDGRHPPQRQHDAAASVESLKQLVDLGYVAPPAGDAATAVRDCMTENRYNLARAHMDAGELDAAIAILNGLIAEDAEQVRYHQHLFQCLLARQQYEQCAQMLDALDVSCPDMARRAATTLKERRTKTPEKELVRKREPEARREMFERRQLAEKLGAFTTERMLMRCSLLLAQGRPEDKATVRPLLDRLAAVRALRRPLALFLAEGYAQLDLPDQALAFTRRVRRIDRDNWRALALEAQIHHRAGRYAEAADRAIDSLALVYLQPTMHYLLGVSLLRLGESARAEQALRVALAQAPGLIAAHEALAALLRQDPAKLADASVHMARAESLRRNRRAPAAAAPIPQAAPTPVPAFARDPGTPPDDRGQLITVVTGLPRSGTSMMMQMLAKGGIEPFADAARAPDSDNPRGYFEHKQASRLHQDSAWLPLARGKAVKIVAPLLPYLPAQQHYRLIFMHRPLPQVVASQRSMLKRLALPGANLDDAALMRAYTSQLVRVQTWLGRTEIPVLPIAYDDAVADPAAVARRLADFLGAPFTIEAAAAAVDPSLRHRGGDRIRA